MLKEEPGSDMEDTCTVHVKEEEEMEMESSEMKGKLKIDISFFTILSLKLLTLLDIFMRILSHL